MLPPLLLPVLTLSVLLTLSVKSQCSDTMLDSSYCQCCKTVYMYFCCSYSPLYISVIPVCWLLVLVLVNNDPITTTTIIIIIIISALLLLKQILTFGQYHILN